MADPMKKVLPSKHSQAPRTDILNTTAKEISRKNFGTVDEGYSGPNRTSTSDSDNDEGGWTEKT